MVGDYHDAVCGANLLVSKFYGRKRRAIAFGVGIAESQLAHKRIVIAHVASFAAQTIDNRKRRALAHVVDVPLISHAQHQEPRTLHRFAIVVQSVRHKLHDMFRHARVHFFGQTDEA